MNDEMARWGLLGTLLTYEGAWGYGDPGSRPAIGPATRDALRGLLQLAASMARSLEGRARA